MKQIINEAKLMELSRSAGVLAPLSREVTVDWWSGIRLRQWWRSVAAAAPATVVRSAPQSDPTVGALSAVKDNTLRLFLLLPREDGVQCRAGKC